MKNISFSKILRYFSFERKTLGKTSIYFIFYLKKIPPSSNLIEKGSKCYKTLVARHVDYRDYMNITIIQLTIKGPDVIFCIQMLYLGGENTSFLDPNVSIIDKNSQ
jgi:hypothetical protein